MKYFIKPLGKPGNESQKNCLQGKLYVAYINRDIANDADLYGEITNANAPRYKASAFISSGQQISDNDIPVILSQEEEMMLYSDEYY